MPPVLATTISEQIEKNNEKEISYRSLHSVARIHDVSSNVVITVPYLSLMNKYRYLLDAITVTYILDEELQMHYRYKPKTLSEDLYGTVDLWFELLRLNHMRSIIDFTPKKVKVYDPDKIRSFINEILILEGII